MPSLFESINPITPQFTANFIPRATIDRFSFGQVLPDFTLPDASGNPVSLSQFRGAPLLLVFTRIFTDKIFCPICYPHLQDLSRDAEEFKSLGANMLVLNTTSPPMTAQISKDQGYRFPLLSDESWTVYHLYGIGSALGAPLPAQFILDQNGTLVYKYLSGTSIEEMLPSLPPNQDMKTIVMSLSHAS